VLGADRAIAKLLKNDSLPVNNVKCMKFKAMITVGLNMIHRLNIININHFVLFIIYTYFSIEFSSCIIAVKDQVQERRRTRKDQRCDWQLLKRTGSVRGGHGNH
jgi:hypothetical protein